MISGRSGPQSPPPGRNLGLDNAQGGTEYVIGVVEDAVHWDLLAEVVGSASLPYMLMTVGGSTSTDVNYPLAYMAVGSGTYILQCSKTTLPSGVGYYTVGIMERVVTGTTNTTFNGYYCSGAVMG